MCFRCAVCNRRLIARFFAVAVIIETVLVGINQGNRLLAGEGGTDLYSKIPPTFTVPYVVAMVGALLGTRE